MRKRPALRAALSWALAVWLLVPASPAAASVAQEPAPAACTSSVGPAIAPPASVPSGLPGFHAQWYGQSGYPTLCPGQRSSAVVAYYNSGSLGWYAGPNGTTAFATAFLGTWGPEPGQDAASPLGGDGTHGTLATGWPAYNRIAVQPAPYVAPGQVAWFQFTIQAPATPGYYKLYLRPLIEGAQWLEDFGVYWSVVVLNADGTRPPPPPITCVAGLCWPLTGMFVSGGPVARRAIVARIDDALPARPHYGTSEADMVFEMLVEGNITRYAAIFQSRDPGTIGSIRSARLSDRQTTPMVRGGLVYSGATIEETQAIRGDAAAGAYYDMNASYVNAGYYRVSTRPVPYNMFTSSAAVRDALNGMPGGGDRVSVPAWDFLQRVDHDWSAGGFGTSVPATTLTIPYRSGSTVRYDYDPATRTYARYQDNGSFMEREVDAANGVAIAAANVVIIYTDIWQTSIVEDIFRSYGLDMDLTGEGAATIFRDGRRLDGRWARASIYDAFHFYTDAGERIYLAAGQTWVHPVYKDWVIASQ